MASLPNENPDIQGIRESIGRVVNKTVVHNQAPGFAVSLGILSVLASIADVLMMILLELRQHRESKKKPTASK